MAVTASSCTDLGGLAPSPIGEATRIFSFSGFVDPFGPVGAPCGLALNAGDSISGTLSYDTRIVGSDFTDTSKVYPQNISEGITVLVAGRRYAANSFRLFITDDASNEFYPRLDRYNADSASWGVLLEDGTPTGGTISLFAIDTEGLAISSTSVLDFDPTRFNGFDRNRFDQRLQLYQDNSNFFQARVTIMR